VVGPSAAGATLKLSPAWSPAATSAGARLNTPSLLASPSLSMLPPTCASEAAGRGAFAGAMHSAVGPVSVAAAAARVLIGCRGIGLGGCLAVGGADHPVAAAGGRMAGANAAAGGAAALIRGNEAGGGHREVGGGL